MNWTRGIPSCRTGDEYLWVVNQAEDAVSGKDISEQSLIDEKASEFEVLEWKFSGAT